jgi:hypothetical protein
MKLSHAALRPSRHLVALAFAACLPVGLGACSSSSSPEAATEEGELIGGTDGSETALDAVGALYIYANGREQRFCSATLIAPRVLLTATHCRWFAADELGHDPAFSFRLYRYGRSLDGRPYEASSKTYEVDGSITTGRRGGGFTGLGRDATLFVLRDAVPADVATPIPVRTRPLDPSDEGKTFVEVGYGKGSGGKRMKGEARLDSVAGRPYQRAFGSEAAFRAWLAAKYPFPGGGAGVPYPGYELSSEFDEVHVGLASGGPVPGNSQTCHGDSGGPLLEKVDGHYIVTGVTTGGEDDCTLGSIITRLGPETQDAIARTVAADPPWAWACSGSDSADVCRGAEHHRCEGISINVEHCDAFGAGFSCVAGSASAASCQRRGSGAPPPLDGTATAVREVLFAQGQTCVLGGTGDVTCAGAMYPGGKAVVARGIAHLTNGGDYRIFALRNDGAVLDWGGYPVPVTEVDTVPWENERIGRFTWIDGTCGLRADGSVECWGLNNQLEKMAVVPGATSFSHGNGHGCALRNGAVLCWGDNAQGQLGTSTAPASKLDAVQAKGISDAVAVASSGQYSCAVRQDGRALCWGAVPKTCSDGTSGARCDSAQVPFQAELLTDAVDVKLAPNKACFLRKGGLVSCFGATKYHVAAWEPGAASSIPLEVSEIEGASAVVLAGDAFKTEGVCAITKRGHGLECWGNFDVLPPNATFPGPFRSVAPVDFLASP